MIPATLSFASQFITGSADKGTPAPDFTLKLLNQDKTFTLSDNFKKKPTVLIFGSYT